VCAAAGWNGRAQRWTREGQHGIVMGRRVEGARAGRPPALLVIRCRGDASYPCYSHWRGVEGAATTRRSITSNEYRS
jgi:hypothetical protein